MANAFDGSTSNLDSTFVLETSEEVKQPKKEKESPKMLDSNNNSPKMFATISNLPITKKVMHCIVSFSLDHMTMDGCQKLISNLIKNSRSKVKWAPQKSQLKRLWLLMKLKLTDSQKNGKCKVWKPVIDRSIITEHSKEIVKLTLKIPILQVKALQTP